MLGLDELPVIIISLFINVCVRTCASARRQKVGAQIEVEDRKKGWTGPRGRKNEGGEG